MQSLIKCIIVFVVICFFTKPVYAQKETDERKLWISYMNRVARPVLYNLADDKLKEKMPVELSKDIDDSVYRKVSSYLEAFGRTLSGIAPWLNLENGSQDEVTLRNQYREWTLKALSNAVNPRAKDYMQWNSGQSLVDASFLAFGLVRCPWLWQHLDTAVKRNVISSLKATRNTVPVFSNWILFSGMIEAFFCKYNLNYDPVRIEYAVQEFINEWYIGDGMFSDGMNFHMDYYNSIVIHPYLDAIVDIVNHANKRYECYGPKLDAISKRYAEILERDINTDGSYLVRGRSITYRCGVFHHLADMALRKDLPKSLPPSQIRSALTAVIKKTLQSTGTFNGDGWLNIGLFGSQPNLGEFYITTGSLYLCTEVFLPLGLPDNDEFWSAPAAPWTSVKIWRGENVPADHAMDLP